MPHIYKYPRRKAFLKVKRMITIKSKKKALIAIVAVTLVVAVASTVVFAASAQAEEPLCYSKRVEVYARGIARQQIENETVKMPAELNFTLYLGERHGPFTPILGAQGTADINGTVYEITCGGGKIFHRKDQVFLWLTGVDGENQTFVIRLYAEYFWMGGRLYVARSVGVFKTDTRMWLGLRAKAYVFPE